MYKIRIMNINDYTKIINLWKNTPGIGLSRNNDSKNSIKYFWKEIGTLVLLWKLMMK